MLYINYSPSAREDGKSIQRPQLKHNSKLNKLVLKMPLSPPLTPMLTNLCNKDVYTYLFSGLVM